MKTLVHIARRFLRSTAGPTTVEYAVLLTLIIMVCIGTITTLGLFVDASYGKAEVALH